MANSPEQKSVEPPAFSPIEVDAFEQLAAHIKPSWEQDDPPFSMGRRSLSGTDWSAVGPTSGARAAESAAGARDAHDDGVDAARSAEALSSGPLVGGPSVNGSARSSAGSTPPPARPAHPKSAPLLDVSPAPAPARGAPSFESSAANPARPRPPKVSSPSFTDESVAAMRPKRTGLVIGILVAAIAGVAVAFAFMQSSNATPKTQPDGTSTAAPTADPPRTDLGSTPASNAGSTSGSDPGAPTATPPTTAAPAPTFVAPVLGSSAAATSSSAAATNKPPVTRAVPGRSPTPVFPPRNNPRPAGNHPPPPKSGGIVRDNPF